MKNKIIVWTFVILIFGFGLLNILLPDSEFSMSERRRLEQVPKFTWESVSSGKFMTDFEEYSQDQFVGREAFRTLKAVSEVYGFQKKDNNNIYVADGYASALEYPLNEESLVHAADRFRYVYETYLEGTKSQIYYSVIPDKNYFLAEANGYLSMDYEKMISVMQKQASFMEYIDITGQLTLEDYYRTDTHWKQECLVDVAGSLADGMSLEGMIDGEIRGEEEIDIPDYEEVIVSDEFYGVYAGQSALPLKADTLKYLDSELLQKCIVYDYQNEIYRTVYDLELAKGKDPYELYLSGDISLMTIENPAGQTGKELILFRDSFGSSIAPLLMGYYDKITLVDIRYLPSSQLGNYIEFDGQDVLFLYSTLVLNHSETLK